MWPVLILVADEGQGNPERDASLTSKQAAGQYRLTLLAAVSLPVAPQATLEAGLYPRARRCRSWPRSGRKYLTSACRP